MEWTAPTSDGGSALTGYKLTHSTGQGSSPIIVGASTTEYAFSNLAVGTTYTFSVVAVNSVGDSASSASVSAQTAAATVPPAPTGLTQKGGTQSQTGFTM